MLYGRFSKMHKLILILAAAAAMSAQSVGSDPGLKYTPPTATDRVKFVIKGTVGLPNLAAGVVTSGISTWQNSPVEYGPHWEGFGKRYGIRLAAGAEGQTIEAGLGSLWGEDPRYVRMPDQPFKKRIGNIVKMTFMATNRNGDPMPAYARYIAVPGNSFLSNTWRVDSHADTNSALARIPMSFVNRIISNAFTEFFPDFRERLSRSKGP